jgi:hypothetical protein
VKVGWNRRETGEGGSEGMRVGDERFADGVMMMRG